MRYQKKSRITQGFTLIELLIAIAIVMVLAGLSFGGFQHVQRKQKDDKARVQISLLENAIEDYFADKGVYPDSATGSSGLYDDLYGTPNNTLGQKVYLGELDPNSNRQGWTKTTSPGIFDPFGNEYIYRTGAQARNPDFDLLSLGNDGVEDTAGSSTKDDISNF